MIEHPLLITLLSAGFFVCGIYYVWLSTQNAKSKKVCTELAGALDSPTVIIDYDREQAELLFERALHSERFKKIWHVVSKNRDASGTTVQATLRWTGLSNTPDYYQSTNRKPGSITKTIEINATLNATLISADAGRTKIAWKYDASAKSLFTNEPVQCAPLAEDIYWQTTYEVLRYCGLVRT